MNEVLDALKALVEVADDVAWSANTNAMDQAIENARAIIAKVDAGKVVTSDNEDDPIARYALKGGPTPRVGVIRDSFWAGYKGGLNRIHAGVPRSVQRKAYQAGMARAKVEPGIKVT